jgi:hypothetical protein
MQQVIENCNSEERTVKTNKNVNWKYPKQCALQVKSHIFSNFLEMLVMHLSNLLKGHINNQSETNSCVQLKRQENTSDH